MEQTKKQNKNSSYYINALISVAIMAFFRFIPPFGAMTTLGMTILGIFLGVLWGWIKCEMAWPSVLAFILLGFTGYVPNVGAGITSAFSNGIVQMILWLLFFAAILTVSGISEQLANRLVSSKMIKGRPWLLSIVILAAAFICALFGASMAALFICWEFVHSVSKQAGFTKEDKWPKMMLVGVAFSACIGLVVLPFQVGVVASYGYLSSASKGAYGAYNFMQYFMFSIIVGLSIMALYVALCKFVVRPDMSKLKGDIQVGKITEFTAKQKIAIWALVAMIVLTIVPSLLPKTSAIAKFINNIGLNAIILGICVAVTLFRDKEGKPHFTFQELGVRGVHWGIMLMVSTAIVLGTALSSNGTGFNATFVNAFKPILGGTSPYVFTLLICIATILLTNVVNNAVAGAVMVPLMFSFAPIVGANPMLITGLIVFASNVGLCLPCASPSGALLAGQKEWLNTKEIMGQVSVGIVATIGAMAIIGIPIGNMIFK